MKKRSSSIGILNLKRDLENNREEGNLYEFKPFQNQRNLGKLILDTQKSERKMSLMDINFLNFKKLYKKQSLIAQSQYYKLSRNPNQKDLLSRGGWTMRKLTPSLQALSGKNNYQRSCCKKNDKTLINKLSKNNFDKIDENLYKKINSARPNFETPEINELFKHYVQACQLNQNIRRQQLVKKRKY